MTLWSDAERAAWRVSTYKTLSEWAEANVVLPEASTEPGPLNLSRTPYLRDILNAISTPWVEEVTFPAGAQIGKTTLEIILTCWNLEHYRLPALFVMGRDTDAITLCRDRVKPTILASPNLARLVKSVSRDLKQQEVHLQGVDSYFDTAGSAAALASKPIGVVCFDETHLYPASVEGEGDPIQNGRVRTSNFPGRKIIKTSTMTDPFSLIWREYQNGTMRVWMQPCPHCGTFFAYKFAQIKFPKGERDPDYVRTERMAWYECEHCGNKIPEEKKDTILHDGAFYTDKKLPKRPSHESFLVSGVASPWRSFSSVAAYFLETQKESDAAQRAEKLRSFHNLILGENFVDRLQVMDTKRKEITTAGVARGTVPNECQMLTGGVDWHGEKKGLYWQVWGWAGGGESYLVDYGNVFSIEELEAALFEKKWQSADKKREFMLMGGADMGYAAQIVYRWTRKLFPRFRPTKGDGNPDAVPFRDSRIEYKEGAKKILLGNFTRLHINVNYYKDALARDLEEGRVHWCNPLDEWVLEHLEAEVKIRDKNKLVWRPKYESIPNHGLDCRVIAHAIAERFGSLRLQKPKAKPDHRGVPVGARLVAPPQRKPAFVEAMRTDIEMQRGGSNARAYQDGRRH